MTDSGICEYKDELYVDAGGRASLGSAEDDDIDECCVYVTHRLVYQQHQHPLQQQNRSDTPNSDCYLSL